ncbi:MAG: hypothetical protein COA73_14790 [Candidatus Hydrogenedentota bacterium]|nr:MAG: hypothetical protein COA73_14790 [Candidatus Hydrogenedentota bacterium]
MKLTVDNDSHFTLVSNPKTLSDVLLDVTQILGGDGQLIQSIVLNGGDIAPDALTPELGATTLDAIDTLEIVSANMMTLVRESLLEMVEVLPELPAVCHSLAEVLQSDNPVEGFGQFNQLLDIWEVVKERQLQAVNALALDPEALKVGEISLAVHNATLETTLSKSRAMMEASDFAGLGDLLSYDMNDMAQAESKITDALLKMLR